MRRLHYSKTLLNKFCPFIFIFGDECSYSVGDLENTAFFPPSHTPLHENLNWSVEKKENKEEKKKHRKAQQKLQQRDVELAGVENNFSLSISVFLRSQTVRSVAKLTACVGHMASPVVPCPPLSSHPHISPRFSTEGIVSFKGELFV